MEKRGDWGDTVVKIYVEGGGGLEQRDFFGKGFQSSALPTIENGVESISKKTVNESLKKATIVSSKGVYGKGAHSFRLLEIIDPVKVTQASPWAKRLIDGLRGEL